MRYQLKIKGKTYELPKKTIAIMEQIQELSGLDEKMANAEISIEQAITSQFDFISSIVGDTARTEILGTDSVYDADADEILYTAVEIIKAYTMNAIKIKNEAASKAKKTYFLCDESKLNKNSLMNFFNLEDSYLITNAKEINENIKRKLKGLYIVN